MVSSLPDQRNGRETLRLSRREALYGSIWIFSHDATFIETRPRHPFRAGLFPHEQPSCRSRVAFRLQRRITIAK